MVDNFTVSGISGFSDLSKLLEKDVQKQVDLASKVGINRATDQVAYGRVSNIRANNVNSKGAVAKAAKALRIPVEHIFYRTFTQSIKVSTGRGRLAKPYASIMMRGNGINIADLLATGDDAKKMYGFTSRKRGVSGKTRPNLKAKASAARVGGRRGGSVRIAGRTYSNAYLEDGSKRNSSEKMNRYYMDKLGAKAFKLKGRRFLLLQKKDAGQKLPYPVKAVKINKQRVMRALRAAASASVTANSAKINTLQYDEVKKRLKKLGFKVT